MNRQQTFDQRLRRTYIGRHYLLVPCVSRKVFAKQAFSNRTVCSITTDDVVTLDGLLARWCLALNPCFVGILPKTDDLMLPADGAIILVEEYVEHQLDEILENKTCGSHITIYIFEAFSVKTRDITVVIWIPPAH